MISCASPAFAQDAVNPPVKKAPANPSPSPTPEAPPSTFAGSSSVSQYLWGQNNFWDKTYDQLQAYKAKFPLVFSVGADHWFHLDRDERIYGNGYGVPTESGTYYYYVGGDLTLKLNDSFFKEIGAHAQFRFRDDQHDKLRSFYYDTYWFYESYGYAKTTIGTFKAGQIVTQFGLPWDGTWWEGVPYFDGYKFDRDYGVSWENAWKRSDLFTVNSVVQFFFASDRVNGSIPGADAESAPGLRERNTGVVRLVPTWQFNHDLKLEWGISGLVGQISGPSRGITDSARGAFGSDVTVTWKNFGVFAEYIDAFGTANPVRYVSGGPSDRVDSLRGGVSYKYGPVTAHVVYSRGWDHNPGGHQFVFDPGVSIQVTKNVIVYAEYVKWNVTNRKGATAKFDDGFELIAVWNL